MQGDIGRGNFRGGPGRGGGIGRGGGRGRMGGNRPGLGPGGNCICPNCHLSIQHTAGTPCYTMKCPKCGANMIRG